jgi:hypothetical protein
MFWHQGGHELDKDDVAAAKPWLSNRVTKSRERKASQYAEHKHG